MIPYGRQHITNIELQKVREVMLSNNLTQGKLTPIFEKKLSQYTKSKYAVASNSGTSALHISCLSLGLKKNDIVWTSPNSFIASANCAEYCEAKIDFVDIDYKTGNMSVEFLEEKLIYAKKKKLLPKILIPVHFGGHPTNQKKIWELSKKYNFKILEDASHSLGAKNKNENVGSCKFSDITVFSFHPVKSITTAEGGASTTNSKIIYDKLLKFRAHGVTQGDYKYKGFYCSYFQDSLGYNYRLSDVHSAIGIGQIENIKKILKKRKEICQRYLNSFKGSNIEPINEIKNIESSNHLFVIRPKKTISKFFTNNSINYLRKKGIGVNCHYFPIHLQPYYRNKGFKIGLFKNAEKHAKLSVSIPVFVSLKKNIQDNVIGILLEYYNNI